MAVSLTPVIDCPAISARASCAKPETIFAPQTSPTVRSTLRPSRRLASMVIRSLFAAIETDCLPSATETLAFASRAPLNFVRTSGDRSSRSCRAEIQVRRSPVGLRRTVSAPARRAEARLSPRLSTTQPPSLRFSTWAEPCRAWPSTIAGQGSVRLQKASDVICERFERDAGRLAIEEPPFAQGGLQGGGEVGRRAAESAGDLGLSGDSRVEDLGLQEPRFARRDPPCRVRTPH